MGFCWVVPAWSSAGFAEVDGRRFRSRRYGVGFSCAGAVRFVVPVGHSSLGKSGMLSRSHTPIRVATHPLTFCVDYLNTIVSLICRPSISAVK